MRARVHVCGSSVVVFIRPRPGLLPLLLCTGKCLHASPAVFKWPAWDKNPSAGMKRSQGGADEWEAGGEGLEGSQHRGRQEAAVICLLLSLVFTLHHSHHRSDRSSMSLNEKLLQGTKEQS